MAVFVLYLYKKKNIIAHCGTIDYYEDVKVGELIFHSKPTAASIKKQLEDQKLFDKIEMVQI